MNKRIRRFISKGLIASILFINTPLNSFAGTLSYDTRYETFNGNNFIINDVLEEDAIDTEIEGNTLVNIHKKQNYSFNSEGIDSGKYDKVESENSVKVTFNEELKGWKYVILGVLDLNLIKPNSTYSIYFDKAIGLDWVAFCYGNYTGHIGTAKNFKVTDNKATITTTNFVREDVSPSIILYGYVNTTVGTTAEISNAMIFEGDLKYKNLEYFEGMKSVGELNSDNNRDMEILSVGKNLFDNSVESTKKILFEDGTEHLNEAWLLYDFLPITENTTITISEKRENYIYFQYKIGFYDKDKKFLSMENITNHSGLATLTTPRFTRYYKLAYSTIVGGNPVNREDIMIEVGNQKSGYMPYSSKILSIPLSEPLRSLPDGTKDRIIKKDGQYIIERNVKKEVLNGSETWVNEYENDANYGVYCESKGPYHPIVQVSDKFICNGYINDVSKIGFGTTGAHYIKLYIPKKYLNTVDVAGVQKYLSNNNIAILFKLETPIYEPLNGSIDINLHKEVTNIFNNSIIPLNIRMVVDRVANRAKEFYEIAKENPTSENIALARMWANLMKESILKDEFQNDINSIVKIEDISLEKKHSSSNIDLYIKSENSLVMSLNTNSIIFEDFSGVEDDIKENAVNISVSSSLPYQLNAYLATGIQNSDSSNTINKLILNIKESGQTEYKTFNALNDKVVLKDSCESGNNKQHNIDLKLNAGIAHEKDAYKTTIQFEAEQL